MYCVMSPVSGPAGRATAPSLRTSTPRGYDRAEQVDEGGERLPGDAEVAQAVDDAHLGLRDELGGVAGQRHRDHGVVGAVEDRDRAADGGDVERLPAVLRAVGDAVVGVALRAEPGEGVPHQLEHGGEELAVGEQRHVGRRQRGDRPVLRGGQQLRGLGELLEAVVAPEIRGVGQRRLPVSRIPDVAGGLLEPAHGRPGLGPAHVGDGAHQHHRVHPLGGERGQGERVGPAGGHPDHRAVVDAQLVEHGEPVRHPVGDRAAGHRGRQPVAGPVDADPADPRVTGAGCPDLRLEP
jgi:hypothetical protein